MSVLVALQLQASASFVQPAASWAAIVPATSDATFVQAAATWNAADSEIFNATGTWTQAAASWDAADSETFTATAAFVQGTVSVTYDDPSWTYDAALSYDGNPANAQWSATVTTGAAAFTSTASWVQAAATWDATATGPAPSGGGQVGHLRALRFDTPLRKRPTPRIEVDHLPEPERIGSVAVFVQAPASWHAEMDTYDPYELWLLTDEPALIGAR